MSVSYQRCDCCKESKYEEYVGTCSSCGNYLCTRCLVNDDLDEDYAHRYGIRFSLDMKDPDLYKENGEPWFEEGEIIDDSGIDKKYCPFCEGGEIDKEALFQYLIGKLNIDIDKEWKEFNKTK